MKRWVAAFILLLLVGISSAAAADQTVTVLVNGRPLIADVPPQIIGGRTMVPLRFLAQALGAEVGWDAASYTATVTTAPPEQPLWSAPLMTSGQADSSAVVVPCSINQWTGGCVLDTGTSYGASIPPAVAAAANVAILGQVNVTTASGAASVPYGMASVAIGTSPPVKVQVALQPAPLPAPLIGLQFLIDSCSGHLELNVHMRPGGIACYS